MSREESLMTTRPADWITDMAPSKADRRPKRTHPDAFGQLKARQTKLATGLPHHGTRRVAALAVGKYKTNPRMNSQTAGQNESTQFDLPHRQTWYVAGHDASKY